MERRLVAILAADVAGYPGRGGGRTPRITGPGFGWGLSCALKAKILRKPSGASAGQSLRLRARLQEHLYRIQNRGINGRSTRMWYFTKPYKACLPFHYLCGHRVVCRARYTSERMNGDTDERP